MKSDAGTVKSVVRVVKWIVWPTGIVDLERRLMTVSTVWWKVDVDDVAQR